MDKQGLSWVLSLESHTQTHTHTCTAVGLDLFKHVSSHFFDLLMSNSLDNDTGTQYEHDCHRRSSKEYRLYKYEEIILKLMYRLKRCRAKPLWLCISVHSMKINAVQNNSIRPHHCIDKKHFFFFFKKKKSSFLFHRRTRVWKQW